MLNAVGCRRPNVASKLARCFVVLALSGKRGRGKKREIASAFVGEGQEEEIMIARIPGKDNFLAGAIKSFC